MNIPGRATLMLYLGEILLSYKSNANITTTAKEFCEKHGFIYDDTVRRNLSKVLSDIGYNNSNDDTVHTAKILVYDIETSPLISYHWGLWDQNINYEDVIQDWKILTFSAKWLFEDKIISDRLTPEELENFDDQRITKNLWALLDEADIVIAHNGKKFDNKKANAKFLEWGLNSPRSFQTIDTLEHARRRFALTSNRLDAIALRFGIGRKVDTPKGMWRAVMQGDYEMLVNMDNYCKGDVKLLEDVYLFMRPYIVPHPNVGLFVTLDVASCPVCGSANIIDQVKPYCTQTTQYDLMRCADCGSLSRNRKTNNILTSVK